MQNLAEDMCKFALLEFKLKGQGYVEGRRPWEVIGIGQVDSVGLLWWWVGFPRWAFRY